MKSSKRFIGIDLGGTNLKGVVINRKGDVLYDRTVPTRPERGPSAVIQSMIELINILSGQIDSHDEAYTIGIAAAGVVDSKRGKCLWLPNLPGWKDIGLVEVVEDSIDSNVFLINDVRAMTLAEKTIGVGEGVENLICIAIGTGIGGGIILNNMLYFGSEGFAGEIGHQVVDPQGPKCTCGNYGCLETLASGAYIVFQAIRLVKQGATTVIRDMADDDLNKITPGIIARAAKQGDVIAKEIWEKEAFYLGIGIANLVHILNPEMIIMGGGIIKDYDLLIDRIREKVYSRIHLGPDIHNLKIVACELGELSGAIGAALWAMQNS
jgi:glucokinase